MARLSGGRGRARMFCCCCDLPRMTMREQYELSPLMKWRLKRRFPWKLALHIVLLILTTVQIEILNVEDSEYYRACRRNWRNFFMPHPVPDEGPAYWPRRAPTLFRFYRMCSLPIECVLLL